MLFKPEHKWMILNKVKTQTRRAWKKPMVKVGGIYKCKLKLFDKDYFAKIKVTKLYKQKLGDMSREDCKKEGYNAMSFVKIWKDINGSWNPDLEVYVVEFKVIK